MGKAPPAPAHINTGLQPHTPWLDGGGPLRAVEPRGADEADGDGDGAHDATVGGCGAGGGAGGGLRAEEACWALQRLCDVRGALRAVVPLRAVGAGLVAALAVGRVAVRAAGALDGRDGRLGDSAHGMRRER